MAEPLAAPAETAPESGAGTVAQSQISSTNTEERTPVCDDERPPTSEEPVGPSKSDEAEFRQAPVTSEPPADPAETAPECRAGTDAQSQLSAAKTEETPAVYDDERPSTSDEAVGQPKKDEARRRSEDAPGGLPATRAANRRSVLLQGGVRGQWDDGPTMFADTPDFGTSEFEREEIEEFDPEQAPREQSKRLQRLPSVSIPVEARSLEVVAEFEYGLRTLDIGYHGTTSCCFCESQPLFSTMSALYAHTLNPPPDLTKECLAQHLGLCKYLVSLLERSREMQTLGSAKLTPYKAARSKTMVNPPVVLLTNIKLANEPAHKGVDDRGTIDDVLRSIDPQVARYLKKPIMVYNKTSVFSGKALLEFERVTEHNINGYLAADRLVRAYDLNERGWVDWEQRQSGKTTYHKSSKGQEPQATADPPPPSAYAFLATPTQLRQLLGVTNSALRWAEVHVSLLQRVPPGVKRLAIQISPRTEPQVREPDGPFTYSLGIEGVCRFHFECMSSVITFFNSFITFQRREA